MKNRTEPDVSSGRAFGGNGPYGRGSTLLTTLSLSKGSRWADALIIFFLLTSWPSTGRTAAATGESEKPIDMTADSLTVMDEGRKVEAKGNVELRREDSILRAEEVRVDREKQEVEAKGQVSLEDSRGTLRADSIRLNLEQETAEVENGDLFFAERQLSVTGRRFQKLPGQAYHIDDAFFTTCLCESGPPSWKIGASQIDLTREGTGVIRGGTFYIRDIPVFYLPYGLFPLRTERQTGFLFPKFGSSSKDGFRFHQPFFWALSKSSDATLGIDLETRSRVGILSELRNVWNTQTHGQLNLSYFNENMRKNEEDDIKDRTIAKLEIPENRWNVFATHRHAAPLGWTTYSDIAAFSDDLFARELSERLDLPDVNESTLRRSRYSRSRFGLFKSWDSAHLRGEWDFYQDFIQEDERTLHRTPQLSLWGSFPVGRTPLELRWHGDAVNYMRRNGNDGLRLDLRPEMIFPFRLPAHLFGSLSAAPRTTFYHLYESEGSSRRNLSRELVEVRGSLGTSFGRVFQWDGTKLEKIRHIVEPEVSYLFIPGVGQRNIPLMDGVDRIHRRNVLTFALNQRLWGRYVRRAPDEKDVDVEILDADPVVSEDVRELGRVRLALSYDIDRERKGGDTVSDLDMSFRFHPGSFWTVGFDTGLNPGSWQFTQAAAMMALTDPRPITRRVLDADFMQPNSLNLGYRFIRKGPNAFLSEDANIDMSTPANCTRHPLDPRCPGTAFDKDVLGELRGRMLYHLTDHLLLFWNSSYNVRDTRWTSNRAALKMLSKCECWTVAFSLNRSTNPSKTSFDFDIELLGLGSQRSTLR